MTPSHLSGDGTQAKQRKEVTKERLTYFTKKERRKTR
jgi:hypothetical protein